MAKAAYILSLIQAHYAGDKERFTTLALQLAAYEARLGHKAVAEDIKTLIDKVSRSEDPSKKSFHKELQGVIVEHITDNRLVDIIAPDFITDKIKRIIQEFIQRDKLRKHGLGNRRKILLTGPPGTGKTFTASIIANELRIPLFTISMDKVVTKFMGETSAKLRLVFDQIAAKQGVYLFDEFDAIGGERSRDNDVGEMRRVLNSFLQFLERDQSDSLIIAITNNKSLLDQALFRRFDDVILYQLPNKEEKLQLLRSMLSRYNKHIDFQSILPSINGLSHAEISLACIDALKATILNDKQELNQKLLLETIKDRNAAYHK